MEKVCKKCNITKSLVEFGINNSKKDGYNIYCKSCILDKVKSYQNTNIDKLKDQRKLKYNKNNLKIKIQRKIYRKQHPEKVKASKQRYYQNHKTDIQKHNKDYYKHNTDKIIELQYKYKKNRLKTDPTFKILENYRTRLNAAYKVKNIKKLHKSIDLLGCSPLQLQQHLEKQFRAGMNHSNYGFKGWHMDHITPCSSFDLNNIEDSKKCFHYTNIQPLWWYENLEKSDRLANYG